MRLITRTTRVVMWVFAAVGIKALYDRFWPKAKELREPAAEVLDTAKTAAREVSEHAKTAAGQVVAEARAKVNEVHDPTKEATPAGSDADTERSITAPS